MSGGAGRSSFEKAVDVSRETTERLEVYEALIRKWSAAINIVASSTLDEIWGRHFLDSAQAYLLGEVPKGTWVDLGSGGGFPGAIVAILAAERAPALAVTCIESDIRKCEFMRTVARETGIRLNILSRRIEDAPPQAADVISARALAPLVRLLPLVCRHAKPGTTAILPKGENWNLEVAEARKTWRFDLENFESVTSPRSVILKLKDLTLG